jgi:hypothetical protein
MFWFQRCSSEGVSKNLKGSAVTGDLTELNEAHHPARTDQQMAKVQIEY